MILWWFWRRPFYDCACWLWFHTKNATNYGNSICNFPFSKCDDAHTEQKIRSPTVEKASSRGKKTETQNQFWCDHKFRSRHKRVGCVCVCERKTIIEYIVYSHLVRGSFRKLLNLPYFRSHQRFHSLNLPLAHTSMCAHLASLRNASQSNFPWCNCANRQIRRLAGVAWRTIRFWWFSFCLQVPEQWDRKNVENTKSTYTHTHAKINKIGRRQNRK